MEHVILNLTYELCIDVLMFSLTDKRDAYRFNFTATFKDVLEVGVIALAHTNNNAFSLRGRHVVNLKYI